MELSANTVTIPICFNCKHFIDNGKYTCDAFPDSIPNEILIGDNDHKTPLPKQKNKITFENAD
jgi:hypothetical protein